MQVRLYKSLLMQEIETLANDSEVTDVARYKILVSLNMQLRKTCLHPFLVEGFESLEEPRTTASMLAASGKLAVLDMLLRSLYLKRHRVVLFSQFTLMLDILAEYCTRRGWNFCRYDGTLSRAKRNYVVNAFNEAGSSIFICLMSTRAGNLGCKLLRKN